MLGEMPKDAPAVVTVMQLTRPNNRTLSATAVVLRADTVTSAAKMPPVKRVCLGGRGREWAAESLKLLETMTELKDAKIFLEPMDPVKFPEYYTLVSDPIDLSKIMLKFHGGAYSNLQQFTKDMRDMFDNYKAFFNDTQTEVYNQVRRLCSWFESESERIQTRWYRLCMNTLISPSVATANSLSVPPRVYQPRTGSLEARIQAIEADNQRIIGMCPTTTAPRPTLSLTGLRAKSAQQTPIYAIRLGGGSNQSANSVLPLSSAACVSSPAAAANVFLMSKTSTVTSTVPGTGVYVCPRGSTATLHTSSTPILAAAKMVLIVDVTNVWFGAARCKPSQPIVISEQGIKLVFKDADTNVEFTIEASEIVRCAAYFGNARKHTLFVFVVPNCTRRLPASLADRHSLSTLVVIFLPALGQRQIADLVYIFWRIGHLSMFGVGGGLLTEIDQKGALSLLSNIKPTILSTVAERMRDIAGAELPSLTVANENGCPVTQHVAVPVTVSGGSEKCSDALVTAAVDDSHYTTMSGRRVKRKSFAGDDIIGSDNDVDSNKQQRLRIKLTKCQPKILKHRRKQTPATIRHEEPQSSPQTHDSATATACSNAGRGAAAAGGAPGADFVCKTEVVDTYYEHEMVENCAVPPTSSDLSEQYTIIEQWDTDGATPSVAAAAARGLASSNSEPDGEEEEEEEVNDVENDLEIVLPSESEDADIEVDSASFDNGAESQDECHQDEDLVMTREKLNLRCPITQQIMKHPMKNKHCGHCYDRQGVEDLISNRGKKARCPVTGCCNDKPLNINDLKHEYNLWQYIQTKATAAALSS